MAAIQQKRKREDEGDVQAPRPAPNAPSLSAVDHFNDPYLHEDEAMANEEVDFDAAFPAPEQEAAVEDDDDEGEGEGEEAGEQSAAPPAVKPSNPASASDTAAAAMAQYHTMTVPQSTESAFMSAPKTDDGLPLDASAEPPSSTAPRTGSFGDFEAAPPNGGDASPDKGLSMTPSRGKPPVGTEEWHKIRKDNHKEVERRRRETINEGINELAKIVPGCEKNKGSILGRAVQFITQLKENETQNIEKWTLEKLLTEQAISELTRSVDKLKAECQRAWADCEQWKRAAQKAGVGPEGKGVEGDAEGEDVD